MERYEELLRERAGMGKPFKVPEGYFDSLVPEIMERIPQRQRKPALIIRMWRPVACAACAAAAVVCALTFGLKGGSDSQTASAENQQLASQIELSQEEYLERVADYAMMDNYDIYAFVSEN